MLTDRIPLTLQKRKRPHAMRRLPLLAALCLASVVSISSAQFFAQPEQLPEPLELKEVPSLADHLGCSSQQQKIPGLNTK